VAAVPLTQVDEYLARVDRLPPALAGCKARRLLLSFCQ
jgi:hypothetical protein